MKWHALPLCGWKRCRLVEEKRGSEGRVGRLREMGDKWPWRGDDSVISETVTVTFIHISKKERWKKSRNNEAMDLQAEREGKRGMINKWGAAGLVRASKVRGTFTPVPQGCRAAKAQLEIRSGERCPWQCSGGLAGLQTGRRGQLACPKEPPASCAHATKKNTNSGVIEAWAHAVFIQHLYYSSQTDCYTVRFTHASLRTLKNRPTLS